MKKINSSKIFGILINLDHSTLSQIPLWDNSTEIFHPEIYLLGRYQNRMN